VRIRIARPRRARRARTASPSNGVAAWQAQTSVPPVTARRRLRGDAPDTYAPAWTAYGIKSPAIEPQPPVTAARALVLQMTLPVPRCHSAGGALATNNPRSDVPVCAHLVVAGGWGLGQGPFGPLLVLRSWSGANCPPVSRSSDFCLTTSTEWETWIPKLR